MHRDNADLALCIMCITKTMLTMVYHVYHICIVRITHTPHVSTRRVLVRTEDVADVDVGTRHGAEWSAERPPLLFDVLRVRATRRPTRACVQSEPNVAA